MQADSRIYIAGHNGLVGSAIVKNLADKGYTNLIGRTHSELELTDQQAVAKFLAREKPEYVFLAAAKVGGIAANNRYRAEFIYDNLTIQNNVIHQSYKNNVKKLLFLGSTCIYPGDAPQPISEEYLLNSPLEYTNEPYAIAKIAGMKMCESYNLQYDTNYIVVMPTNLYGPNDNFDLQTAHVFPALIRKIHLGKALEDNDWKTIRRDLHKRAIEGNNGNTSEEDILNTLSSYGLRIIGQGAHPVVQVEIWGSGKPKREFLWSEDMADACVYLMQNHDFSDIVASEIEDTEIRNTHINIGTGEDVSIKELACNIKKVIGFNGELYFNTDKPNGTMNKLSDVSKLHTLGWRHRVRLKDGLQKLYHWYLENL